MMRLLRLEHVSSCVLDAKLGSSAIAHFAFPGLDAKLNGLLPSFGSKVATDRMSVDVLADNPPARVVLTEHVNLLRSEFSLMRL